MSITSNHLQVALANAKSSLLELRQPSRGWTGELASSALATAVAVFALALARRKVAIEPALERIPSHLVPTGLDWLVAHQNNDGGWGDTPDSSSNVSTTILAWSALTVGGEGAPYSESEERARQWLSQEAGGLQVGQLANAVSRRYGNDRTFSAPILTLCALAGRLGRGGCAWRWVKPLPFELAALPQSWFRWLRLPVVSYALPALIAIGQVRYHFRPPRNPLSWLARRLSRGPTLQLLGRLQPASGGFLEAIPLTAFVLMSLLSMDRTSHPVVSAGVRFLISGRREDGSWPIDTNLETWVSTLSINALAPGSDFSDLWTAGERGRLVQWLLDQQFLRTHPYTGAAPGGWAWTPLPGGVPDADDTAGVLLALRHLEVSPDRLDGCVVPGVRWLVDLANRDGGIPTFCRGWGKLEFDRSSPDITAHVLRAWAAWQEDLPEEWRVMVTRAGRRALQFLQRSQGSDGTWTPLWFGNQSVPAGENRLYGTARVLLALQQVAERYGAQPEGALRDGIAWMLKAQNPDGGWGSDAGTPSSIEETAVAVEALAACWSSRARRDSGKRILSEIGRSTLAGAGWLVQKTHMGTQFPAAPIGLYFARLFYSEKLYPLVFTVAALQQVQRSGLLDTSAGGPSPDVLKKDTTATA